MGDDPHDLRRPAGDRDGCREHRRVVGGHVARRQRRARREGGTAGRRSAPPPTCRRVRGLEPGQGEPRRRPADRRRARTRRRPGESGRRRHRGLRRGGCRPLGPRCGSRPRVESGPRLLLGEGLRLERGVRHVPRVRGHRRRQGRRLQPRAVRVPVRSDLRQRAVGQRRHGPYGVQWNPRRAPRARDDGARPGGRGDHGPGLQPARLLRHHDMAAHAANHRISSRFVGDVGRDGRQPLQLLRPHARRPVGDLHADAPPPGARAQPGGRDRAHLRRSPLRQAAAVRHRGRRPGLGGPPLGGDVGATVRALGEGLPGRRRHRVRVGALQ